MILKLLIRSHFSVTGSHEGFKFEDLLRGDASERKLSLEDCFYHHLGYGNDKVEPFLNFTLRKKDSQGDKAYLQKEFLLRDKSDISKALEALGAKSHRGNVRKPKIKFSFPENLVRLLSSFYRNNEERILLIKGNTTALFSDYIRNMRIAYQKDELNKIIQSEAFLRVVQNITPEIQYVKNSTPFISKGVLTLNIKLSPDKLRELVLAALYDAIFGSLDVPDVVYSFVSKNISMIEFIKDEDFLKLIDWSHSLDMTISELASRCGFALVDRAEYFERHSIYPLKVGKDSYKLYFPNSSSIEEAVILSRAQTIYILEAGLAQYLRWDSKSNPFFESSENVYLNTLFPGGPVDFSGVIS